MAQASTFWANTVSQSWSPRYGIKGDEGHASSEGHESHEGVEGHEGQHEGQEGHEGKSCVEDRSGRVRQVRRPLRQERKDVRWAAQGRPDQERAGQGGVSENVCARQACVGEQQAEGVDRRMQEGKEGSGPQGVRGRGRSDRCWQGAVRQGQSTAVSSKAGAPSSLEGPTCISHSCMVAGPSPVVRTWKMCTSFPPLPSIVHCTLAQFPWALSSGLFPLPLAPLLLAGSAQAFAIK